MPYTSPRSYVHQGILVAFCALIASSCFAEDAASRYIRTHLRLRHTPGAAVAVIRAGRVIDEVVYGSASLQLRVPVRRDTQFQLASVTKVFTGLALLVLEQNRQVSLDDPVSKYLTDLPESWRDVSLRELAAHTSGLPDVIESPNRPLSSAELARTEDQAIQFAAAKPARAAPGEKFIYDQTNYVLLKRVIEQVTHMSFQRFLITRILPRTSSAWLWGDCRAIVPLRTEMYKLGSGDVTENAGQLYLYPPYLEAAAGLNASIAQLEKFGVALTRGAILSSRELRRLEEPIRTRRGRAVDMGLDPSLRGMVAPSIGFIFADNSGGKLPRVLMTGGSAVVAMYFPKQQLLVVVLTNLQTHGDPIELAEGTARFYIHALVPIF
ncbi:MAG TPA: serine hydrolase domain-containing protein [Steroidobacteraceae bacterium]|nr:serine hydrolase domain-containing protein [Steroidobacteraceae bacterium]